MKTRKVSVLLALFLIALGQQFAASAALSFNGNDRGNGFSTDGRGNGFSSDGRGNGLR